MPRAGVFPKTCFSGGVGLNYIFVVWNKRGLNSLSFLEQIQRKVLEENLVPL